MANPTYSPTAILAILAAHDVDFIVVGGVCAVLHGAAMSTFDLDIVHSRDGNNVKRLLGALDSVEARFREQRLRRESPTEAHLSSPGHQLLETKHGPLDLLGTIGKDRSYEDLITFAEEITVGPMRFKILSLKKLIETKEEAGREKDRAMLPLLRRTLEEKQKK